MNKNTKRNRFKRMMDFGVHPRNRVALEQIRIERDKLKDLSEKLAKIVHMEVVNNAMSRETSLLIDIPLLKDFEIHRLHISELCEVFYNIVKEKFPKTFMKMVENKIVK
ncbi:MAG TPA: hypothetical protein VMZ91_01250 [Candidatus Paceibacterota bacterium]|nr:hypothetical protein [Candidatus Paceibacterota bacterium]